jgi:hypothetical protein
LFQINLSRRLLGSACERFAGAQRVRCNSSVGDACADTRSAPK